MVEMNVKSIWNQFWEMDELELNEMDEKDDMDVID